MRHERDTFLHYLADNISKYKIKNVRFDPAIPDSSRITSGAINVQFLSDNPQVQVGVMAVSIDCVADRELDVIDMADTVFKLLSLNSMCPQYDYTNPQNPVQLSGNIYWDANSLNFRPISDKLYCRYNSLLYLSYHPF